MTKAVEVVAVELREHGHRGDCFLRSSWRAVSIYLAVRVLKP